LTRVTWAPQALEDLQAIRTYLARDSEDYADLTVERIITAVSRLELHPRSGRVVPEIGSAAIRELILGSYRIVYRLRRDVAEVLTVFHGARAFPSD
jgi:toxin ParE1/3/4